MSWFQEISSPESIAAISTGIAAIITAIGGVIYKYTKTKKWDISGIIKAYNEGEKLCKVFGRGGKTKKSK